jgi:hypothetical protein
VGERCWDSAADPAPLKRRTSGPEQIRQSVGTLMNCGSLTRLWPLN